MQWTVSSASRCAGLLVAFALSGCGANAAPPDVVLTSPSSAPTGGGTEPRPAASDGEAVLPTPPHVRELQLWFEDDAGLQASFTRTSVTSILSEVVFGHRPPSELEAAPGTLAIADARLGPYPAKRARYQDLVGRHQFVFFAREPASKGGALLSLSLSSASAADETVALELARAFGGAGAAATSPLSWVRAGGDRLAIPRGLHLRFATVDGDDGEGRVLVYHDELRRCASFEDDLRVYQSTRAEVTPSSRTVGARQLQLADVRMRGDGPGTSGRLWRLGCAADREPHLRVELDCGVGACAVDFDRLLQAAVRLSAPR